MSKGLSNYQIDDFFKDKDNEELKIKLHGNIFN